MEPIAAQTSGVPSQRVRLPSRPATTEAPTLDWGRPGLLAFQRVLVVAVVEAILADEDDDGGLIPGSPAACARALAWMDDALGRASSDVRRGFVVLSILLEWLPLAIVRVPSRMSRLPLERRIAYLEALESSRVGLLSMLLVAFKVPLCIPALEAGEELASLGYDRPDAISPDASAPRAWPSPEPSHEGAP
jgi:hypothetical protein